MHSPRGRLLALQEERTKAYEEWEVAFRQFVEAGSQEQPYAEVQCPRPPWAAIPASPFLAQRPEQLPAARR